jgi:glycosyltransferase involved in cell wall biosynthesis
MNTQRRVTAIFWGPHSRQTEDMARQLDARLHLIHYFAWRRPLVAPFKYVLQNLKTWAVLLRERPSLVYVVIPPTFAALSVYLYCLLTGTPYVMDVHGHVLTSRKWGWTKPLMRFLARRARATVVDQTLYQDTFDAWGARTVLLERAPVRLVPQRPQQSDRAGFSVTLVSIFADDEPVDLVLKAAERLPEIRFYVTGDTDKADPKLLASAPPNVSFVGYLHGDDFWQRLLASNAVMTLTSEPYSLVSGGIEAMAFGKPSILSRTPVLTSYFTKGSVFVDHTAESIAAGVRAAREQEQGLSEEARELAVEKRRRWEGALRELLGLIGETPCAVASLPES